MLLRLVAFLVLNFGALGVGGLFTGTGVKSSWYNNLNKAPWTPPGWMFGAAWTTIMICFSLYMAYLWPRVENKSWLIGLFGLQWILNIIWNPLFFHFKQTSLALISIILLSILVGYFLFSFRSILQTKTLLIVPYFLWLLIASSLNAYIVLNN